jgi:polysaccharide deacetylase 2 family uncharacterized protein YibQ
MTDDLRRPLKRRSAWARLTSRRPDALRAAIALVAVGAVGAAVWLAQLPLPGLTGQGVEVAIERAPDPIVTGTNDSAEAGADTVVSADTGDDDLTTLDPGSSSNDNIAAVDLDELPQTADGPQPAGEQQAMLVGAASVSLAAAPLKSVVEAGPHGPLPRIGKDGRKPWAAYARPVHREVLAGQAPKVAIVLGGMGLNPQLTEAAIDRLPGEVSFAFAPYAEGAQRLVNRARAKGHEVFLQLPMEPFGYPGLDPGPRTLLSTASPQENLDNLAWLMSRFAGYAGVVNYMGARLAGNREALSPIMEEMARRGLVFVDEGLASRTPIAEVASAAGLPLRSAVTVIDADPSPQAVARALDQLEAAARAGGFAIATGTGLAPTIDAVEAWVKAARGRGIVLVPVTAAFRPVSG